jgi:multidrug resistance efflux pump
MDSKVIDELVTLRARVREAEKKIKDQENMMSGQDQTVRSLTVRAESAEAKLQEAEKEREAWKKIASDADEFRPLYEKAETRCAQQSEALRAAREAIREAHKRIEVNNDNEPLNWLDDVREILYGALTALTP